ncbi:hypothetical protein KCV00_g273, partial [Aureobasidium melanogenum]
MLTMFIKSSLSARPRRHISETVPSELTKVGVLPSLFSFRYSFESPSCGLLRDTIFEATALCLDVSGGPEETSINGTSFQHDYNEDVGGLGLILWCTRCQA